VADGADEKGDEGVELVGVLDGSHGGN